LIKNLRMVVFTLLLVSASMLGSAEASYHQGDQSEDIASLQQQLNELGYDAGNADGDFGSATASAIAMFQSDRGLDVDGVIGMDTYRAIMGRDMEASRGGSTGSVRRIIQTALQNQGVPYVFGGTSPGGFDCSGFTRYVFAQAGIYLPRAADEQYEVGQHVSRSRLQPGDLVYFSTYEAGASHVGIYLGDGQFISATSSRGIMVTPLDTGYWGFLLV